MMGRLEHFHISFFAIILGLAGFTLAVQKAEEILGFGLHLSSTLLLVTAILFVVVLGVYGLKMARYPRAVREEFNNNVKVNFFPLLAKILLILSIITLSLIPSLSRWLWIVGVALQLLFTLAIFSKFIRDSSFSLHHITPAIFIPVVGNVIIPIAGVVHAPIEISWFFFSVGMMWWVVLFTIVMNRILFHHPIPDRLVPTMFILFAPPAIGFIALLKLAGTQLIVGDMLFYMGLFLQLLILLQLPLFFRLHFALSWWAYSFPSAAMTIASLVMYHLSGGELLRLLSWIQLLILVGIIALLIILTCNAIRKGCLCVAEERA